MESADIEKLRCFCLWYETNQSWNAGQDDFCSFGLRGILDAVYILAKKAVEDADRQAQTQG